MGRGKGRQHTLLLELLQYSISGIKALHALEQRPSNLIDLTRISEELRHGQLVAHTTLEIIKVVAGGHLHCTSTKIENHKGGVGDDGDQGPVEGVYHFLAMQVLEKDSLVGCAKRKDFVRQTKKVDFTWGELPCNVRHQDEWPQRYLQA